MKKFPTACTCILQEPYRNILEMVFSVVKNNAKSHNQNTKSMLLLLPFLLLMYLVDSILRSFYTISAIWQILMFGHVLIVTCKI